MSLPGEVLQAFDQEKLLLLFSPALSGAKMNLAGFAKLHRVRQLIPFGVELSVDSLALFLFLLTEKLSPKEMASLMNSTAMHKTEAGLSVKLATAAKRLEKDLKSSKLTKASHVYRLLNPAPGEEILLLYLITQQRLVQDRIKNYLQKYLPAAQEITDSQVAALGPGPGTPKFKRLKEELVNARLDGRVKKAPPPAETQPAPPAHEPHGHPGGGPRTPEQPKVARVRTRQGVAY